MNAADDTDPFRSGESRSREVNAGLIVPWRQVRHAQSILGAVHVAEDSAFCAACDRPIDVTVARRSLRSGYAFSSVRTYGYSISPEEGLSGTATAEWIAAGLGSDGNAGSVVADLRGYRRALVPHGVVAGRLASAHAWGDQRVRRDFTAAGDGPQRGGFLFDADAIGLMRGFDDDVRGAHVVVANLDYRFPVWRVERGVGALPAFLRAVHGAVFVDAGRTWNDDVDASRGRVSTGVELSADTVLGYSLPLTVTGGVAVRHDGLDRQEGVAVYGRIGYAF